MNRGAAAPAGRGLALALIYAALSMSIVSSLGMLLVPSISFAFEVPINTAQWTLTINLLVGAASSPVLGRLADGGHRKQVLIVALAMILLGSGVAAVAWDFSIFLLGRALQGLSYGIVPITIALAQAHLEPAYARKAVASLAITVSTGFGLGYPLTGILAGTFDFRVAFWFAFAFTLSAVGVVIRFVPAAGTSSAEHPRFDLTGAALFAVGVCSLLLGISEGPHWGWGSAWTIGSFVAGAVLLSVWAWHELRTPHALIDLRPLRVGSVLLANAAGLSLGMTTYMGVSIISLIAQASPATGFGLGMPLFWAGFVMLPLSIGSFSASQTLRRLPPQLALRTAMPLGVLIVTASAVLLVVSHGELWVVLLGMLLFGLGVGLSYGAMPWLINLGTSASRIGSALGFNQVLRTIGGALGSAVAGAVMAYSLAPDGGPSSTGISQTLIVSAVLCVVILVSVTAYALSQRRRGA